MGHMEETPFFILGADRSGTTLLRTMLVQRFAVAIPPESEFIRDLAAWRAGPSPTSKEVAQLRQDVCSHPRVTSWWPTRRPLSAAAPGPAKTQEQAQPTEAGPTRERIFREIVSGPFIEYATARGMTRWGDKTPSYLDHFELLDAIWPGCRFVFVERDGRDVFCSVRRLPFGPNTPSAAARAWMHALARRDEAERELPGRTRTITYEVLVASPESVVGELGEWLGLQPARNLPTQAAVDPRRQAWFSRLREDVDAVSVGRWRRDLSGSELARFETIAGQALVERGYALSETTSRPTGVALHLEGASEFFLRAWHFLVLRLWRERGRELRYVATRKLRR